MHFSTKNYLRQWRTGKTAIMMVNVMGFSIKVLELSYKQYSFIQGGDGGMGMPCVL
jgi:hypothetical protein